jgi:hypothetical protein
MGNIGAESACKVAVRRHPFPSEHHPHKALTCP